MKKYHIGCGHKILKDYINVDYDKSLGAQLACDLDVPRYPIGSNVADEILCEMTLEHIKYPTKAIAEFHRILKPGGVLKIIVPHFSHFSSHFADIHISQFNCEYFYRWVQPLQDIWGNKEGIDKWTYIPENNVFSSSTVKIIFPGGLLKLLSRPFELIFNSSKMTQGIYEHFFSNFYPANELHVKMIK